MLNHNHIWDLGKQLERFGAETHCLSDANRNRLRYTCSCPCEVEHAKWRQCKEVNLEPMFSAHKVKPCQKATFVDPEHFWYHCVGKSMLGCQLHYALCRILEYEFPGFTWQRQRLRKLDNGYIETFKTKMKPSVKVMKL